MGDTHDKEPLQPGPDRPINSIVSPDRGRTTGNGIVSSGSPDFGYEELSNGLTCPTCQGTGKIPRGQEDDLVALIPYRDERLKPRRTTLYVCLAVFICMAIAGILCAFFIPRPISFVQDRVETIKAEYNKTRQPKHTLNLTLMNYFNVTNPNFVSLEITNISMQVVSTFKGHVINDQAMIVVGKTIPLRTKQVQFQWPVNVTVCNEDYPVAEFCDPSIPAPHEMYISVQSTLYFSLMFEDSLSSVTHYQLVKCVMSPKPEESHHLMRRSRINKLNSGWEDLDR